MSLCMMRATFDPANEKQVRHALAEVGGETNIGRGRLTWGHMTHRAVVEWLAESLIELGAEIIEIESAQSREADLAQLFCWLDQERPGHSLRFYGEQLDRAHTTLSSWLKNAKRKGTWEAASYARYQAKRKAAAI